MNLLVVEFGFEGSQGEGLGPCADGDLTTGFRIWSVWFYCKRLEFRVF